MQSGFRAGTVVVALMLAVGANSGVARAQSNTTCPGAPFFVPAFLAADARGLQNGLSTAEVARLFGAAGITLTWDPSESRLLIIDYGMDYGGEGAQLDKGLLAVGDRNIIKQANGNPVSYTFTFASTILNFSFRRAPLHAGPSGVTNPTWTAIALAADASTVAKVSEAEIRSYSDVPGKTFVLSGSARIKSITFSGDDHKFDGQSNVVIDALGWCP